MTSHKSSAIGFLTMVTDGNIREAYENYVSPAMRHHNPFFKSDARSLESAMIENHEKFPAKSYKIKNVIEEGNFVAVHAHLRLSKDPADPGMATCHILRFLDGKIVELWDMGQPIPPDSPNDKGMF